METLGLLTVSWGAALGLLAAQATGGDPHKAARLGFGAEGMMYGGGTVGGALRVRGQIGKLPDHPHFRLNEGAGRNPMTSAENVDVEPGNAAFNEVIADATGRLPYQSGSMAEIHAINPYNFYPLNAETARLLKPGGVLMVSGGLANKFAKPQAEVAESLGLKMHSVVEGQIPEHQFGTQLQISGKKQAEGQRYRTTIYYKPLR